MTLPGSALLKPLNILLDAVLVLMSLWLAYWIRFESHWIPLIAFTQISYYAIFFPLTVVIYLLVFQYIGLYQKRRGISSIDEFSKIFWGVMLASFLMAALTFLTHFLDFSRLVIGLTAMLAVFFIWIERRLLRRLQIWFRRKGIGITRLLIVGTGETARSVIRRLKLNADLGYKLVGIVSEKRTMKKIEGVNIVGTLKEFSKLIEKHQVMEVLFALPAQAYDQLVPMLMQLQDSNVKYKIVSDLFGLITKPVRNDILLGIPIFEMKEAPLKNRYNRLLKRTFDFVLSTLGIMILSPVFLILALGVKLSSPGPVFFCQKRIGRDGRVFTMFKFRSMRANTETIAFTQQNDIRRTRFGKWLRKTSFDELPQVFNVWLGQMSLVGPRPEVPMLVKQFEKTIPRYFERHQVKAGITGWAQVNGLRGNTSLTERIAYDIYYIENWSLFLDIRILIRTVLEIFYIPNAY
jgi:Undecaprenyl-phosphate glucose phosphotransferase